MILTMKFDRKNELLNALKQYPKQVMRHTRLALKVSARDIQEDAQQNHRFNTQSGNLERSIATQFDDRRLLAKVGVDLGVAPYGLAIHDGSKPHVIRVKNKKLLRYNIGGKFFFSKSVNHPGTKPDPFIINSAKANSPKFQKRIREAISNAGRKAGL